MIANLTQGERQSALVVLFIGSWSSRRPWPGRVMHS